MPSEPYTHIRVRVSTHQRMLAVSRRLVELAEQGLIELDAINPDTKNPKATGLSMDALVNLLLDARDGHNRRARKSRAARKERRSASSRPADRETPPEPAGEGIG